ncbi:tRNA (guanosine(37)-N1)-methyltransferase TrmD [Trebonia sp.]|uniref:tRNA (guanosine(37)-N1)-methyltransferase TrmD n=1 Tax=Trebonia sp. TaxID=2767075 RepID=UPI003BE947CD
MRVDVVTIFPDYFGPAAGVGGPLGVSLIGKAAARGDVAFHIHDLRQWATDVHHTVDDTPFGGGPGMVMKADVWGAALDAILSDKSQSSANPSLPWAATPSTPSASPVPSVTGARLVVPTPSGVPFTQEMALAYAGERHLVFACGRYEGIDARVVEDARARGMAVDEVSIGDYVLAGGEAAVVVIVEAVCRLLPGVLGNERSVSDDSFGGGGGSMHGLLEGPVYTRPRAWRGNEVPAVLLSGDHAAIARWQRDEALRRTAERRPDLIRRLAAADGLDARDRAVLIQAGFPVDGESMAH